MLLLSPELNIPQHPDEIHLVFVKTPGLNASPFPQESLLKGAFPMYDLDNNCINPHEKRNYTYFHNVGKNVIIFYHSESDDRLYDMIKEGQDYLKSDKYPVRIYFAHATKTFQEIQAVYSEMRGSRSVGLSGSLFRLDLLEIRYIFEVFKIWNKKPEVLKHYKFESKNMR